jgi:hypothetical protein
MCYIRGSRRVVKRQNRKFRNSSIARCRRPALKAAAIEPILQRPIFGHDGPERLR